MLFVEIGILERLDRERRQCMDQFVTTRVHRIELLERSIYIPALMIGVFFVVEIVQPMVQALRVFVVVFDQLVEVGGRQIPMPVDRLKNGQVTFM